MKSSCHVVENDYLEKGGNRRDARRKGKTAGVAAVLSPERDRNGNGLAIGIPGERKSRLLEVTAVAGGERDGRTPFSRSRERRRIM